MAIATVGCIADSCVYRYSSDIFTESPYFEWGGSFYGGGYYMKFDYGSFPAGPINRVTLKYYCRVSVMEWTDTASATYNDRLEIAASPILADWNESSTAYVERSNSYSSAQVMIRYPNTSTGWEWRSFDVTGYVINQRNAGVNYGLVVWGTWINEMNGFRVDTVARGGGGAPYLEIDYTVPNRTPNPPILTSYYDGQAFSTNALSFTWNFSDPDPGNTQSWYHVVGSLDGSNWHYSSGEVNSGNWGHTTGTLQEGRWVYFAFRTADQNGWWSGWSYRYNLVIDRTGPSSPGINLSTGGWTNGNVTFTIAGGSDSLSSVARSEYRINWGGWVTYTGTATVSATGSHYIEARSVDSLGNAGAIAGATAYIDKEYPIGSISVNSGSSRLPYNASTVTLTLSASDGYSGVSRMMISNDSTFTSGAWENFATTKTWSPAAGVGTKTIYVKFMDVAGNQSATYAASIIRNTLSSASFTSLANGSTIYNQRPRVTFSATDVNGDSISQYEVWFAADSGFTQNVVSGVVQTSTYTATADIGTGLRYARVRAYDGYDWGVWTTISFTVGTFTGNILDTDTGVRKVWIDELRTANNQIRSARGMAAFTFTDAAITADTTETRAIHLTELRTAYEQIASNLGVTVPAWTDPIIVPDETNRSGVHWKQLRALAARL